MELITAIAVIVPNVLSFCVSGIYAYIAFQKAKEPPKDEVWETALKLLCSDNTSMKTSDDFARLYEELAFFKEHRGEINRTSTIRSAMLNYHADKNPGSSGTGTH